MFFVARVLMFTISIFWLKMPADSYRKISFPGYGRGPPGDSGELMSRESSMCLAFEYVNVVARVVLRGNCCSTPIADCQTTGACRLELVTWIAEGDAVRLAGLGTIKFGLFPVAPGVR